MATQAHCAYCFDVLAASFERRQPLNLTLVEELWEQYHATNKDTEAGGANEDDEEEEDAEVVDVVDTTTTTTTKSTSRARPAAISRLLNRSSASSSSSSLRSGSSSNSSSPASAASSRSSLFSSSGKQSSRSSSTTTPSDYPLFVTWNTHSRSNPTHKSLRGCIGTFDPQPLATGLRSYALTSAFEDVRFHPIPASSLPSLSCHVTLLTNFSPVPSRDPLAWTLGTHGIRISFTHGGRRHGATYLPDVAREQGWSKEEAIVSLMRKAGWNGSAGAWERVWREGKGELVTYEGVQVGLGYAEWKAWREWVDGIGVVERLEGN